MFAIIKPLPSCRGLSKLIETTVKILLVLWGTPLSLADKITELNKTFDHSDLITGSTVAHQSWHGIYIGVHCIWYFSILMRRQPLSHNPPITHTNIDERRNGRQFRYHNNK